MSRQNYRIGRIEWRKRDGDLPTEVILALPGYVYLDTPTNWWGPWIRQELAERFGGKVKRYGFCEIVHDTAPDER